MSNLNKQYSMNAGHNRLLYEIIVAGVPTTGNQQTVFGFPQQQQLNNCKIYKLEVFSQEDVAKSPSGRDVATMAQIGTAFINLYVSDMSGLRGQGSYIQDTPLVCLHTLQNGTNPFEFWPFNLQGQVVTWDQQSKLVLSTPLANTTDVSFIIQVDYLFSTDV